MLHQCLADIVVTAVINVNLLMLNMLLNVTFDDFVIPSAKNVFDKNAQRKNK